MPIAVRRPSLLPNWLFALIAIVATTAQLVVALVPLAERPAVRTMSAHVEAGGVTSHYAHNEATCASCQARSLYGATPRPAITLPAPVRVSSVAIATVAAGRSSDLHSLANPRAPPSVI